jgi:hypothetical protein
MEETPKEDKKWKLECLMNDIRRVELAKMEDPAMYNEAVKKLKGESKAISSLQELKEKGARMAEKEAGYDRDE